MTAMHTRLPVPDVVAALSGLLPTGEDELLAVARVLQSLREEVLGGRTASV